jgi:hypothetical protein
MSLLAVMTGLCLSAAFHVQTVTGISQAPVFLADADGDGAADLLVLNGTRLTIYFTNSGGRTLDIDLLPGTSAIDVADIDGDARNEIIAICGDRIVRYAVAQAGAGPRPQDLFSLHTQLSEGAETAYPHVLTVPRDGRMLLALPCENTLELRTADGVLVAGYPIGRDAPTRVAYGVPFRAGGVEPPQIGSRGALEGWVSRIIELEPELPADLSPVKVEGPARRRGTPSQMRDAAESDAGSWPWFPLKTAGSTTRRALYALASPGYRDTLIRVRESERDTAEVSGKGIRVGPERRYPGAIVLLEEDLPDFNRDGCVDLVLWKAPEPGLSVNSLTQALIAGSWPLDLTVHLFSPEKNRYEPVPSARIACRVPVSWFLMPDSDGPLQHAVLRDFDGDGRTDFGCAVAPDRYGVWVYGEQGFGEHPDFDHTFPEPVLSVEFRADLDHSGCTRVGLRTETALYVISAVPDAGIEKK